MNSVRFPTPAAANECYLSRSGGAVADLPVWDFARAFVPGHIPAGQVPQVLIDGSPVETQAKVLCTHADGLSVLHAALDFIAPTVDGTPRTITFQPQAASPAAAPLDPATIINNASGVEIEIGITGDSQPFTTAPGEVLASCAAMIAQGHYEVEKSGPVVYEWIVWDPLQYRFGIDGENSLTPCFQVRYWPSRDALWVRVITFGGHTGSFQHQDLSAYRILVDGSPVYDHETQLVAAGFNFGGIPNPGALPAADTRARIRAGTSWPRRVWIRNQIEDYQLDPNFTFLREAGFVPGALRDFPFDATDAVDDIAHGSDEWNTRGDARLRGDYIGAPHRINAAQGAAGTQMNIGAVPGYDVAYLRTGEPSSKEMMLKALETACQWPYYGLIETDVSRRYDRAGNLQTGKLPTTTAARPRLHGTDVLRTASGSDRFSVPAGGNMVAQPAVSDGVAKKFREEDPITDAFGILQDWSAANTHIPNTGFVPTLLTGDWFAHWVMNASAQASAWQSNGIVVNNINGRGPDLTTGWAGMSEPPRGHGWAFNKRLCTDMLARDGVVRGWMREMVLDAIASYHGLLARVGFTSPFAGTSRAPLLAWSRDFNYLVGRAVSLNMDPPDDLSPFHLPEIGDASALAALGSNPGGGSSLIAPEYRDDIQVGTQTWMNHFMMPNAVTAYLLGYDDIIPWAVWQAAGYLIFHRHPDMVAVGERPGAELMSAHRLGHGGFSARPFRISAQEPAIEFRWLTIIEMRDCLDDSDDTNFEDPGGGNYLDTSEAYVMYATLGLAAAQEIISLGLIRPGVVPLSTYAQEVPVIAEPDAEDLYGDFVAGPLAGDARFSEASGNRFQTGSNDLFPLSFDAEPRTSLGSPPPDPGLVPLAPVSVGLEVVSADLVRATWNEPPDLDGVTVTGYVVELTVNGGGTWVQQGGTQGPTVFQLEFDPGVHETLIQVRVAAVAAAGQGPYRGSLVVETQPEVPGTLQSFAASDEGNLDVQLSYGLPGGLSLFNSVELQRRPFAADGSQPWAPLAFVTDDEATTYDDTVAEPGVWEYRGRVWNGLDGARYQAGEWVEVAVLVEAAAGTPPLAPKVRVTGVTSTLIDVAGLPATGTPSSGVQWEFQVSTSPSGSFATFAGPQDPATAQLSVGAPSQTRYFRARVITSSGPSDWSAVAYGTTSDGSAPSAPGSLTVTSTPSGPSLVWALATPVEGNLPPTAVLVERSTTGGPYVEIASLPAATLGYVDAAAVQATRYSYRVRQASAAGASAASNVVNVLFLLPPASVTGLAAAPTSPGQVTIVHAGAPFADRYEIQRAVAGGGFQAIYNGPLLTVIDQTVPTWQSLSYRVIALNSAGKSAPVAAATFVMPGRAADPLITNTVATSSSIRVDFEGQNAGYPVTVQYVLQAAASAAGPWIDAGVLTSSPGSFFYSGLPAETTFFLRMVARPLFLAASFHSEPSEPVEVATLAAPAAVPGGPGRGFGVVSVAGRGLALRINPVLRTLGEIEP